MLTPEKRELIAECQAVALAIVLEARTKKAWWIGVMALPTPPGYRFTLVGPFRKGAAIHRRGADPNALTAQRLLEALATRKGGPFTREELKLYTVDGSHD